jgi:glucose/arabinose dehydrogenase
MIRLRPNLLTLALCLTLLVTSVTFAASRPAATTPDDFEDTLVTDQVNDPTALAFMPDGRMLITSRFGQVRVYKSGALLPTPALNIGSKLCTNSERGLLGIAVDPQFAQNPYVYVYYTFNKSGECPTGAATNAKNPVNRVSRFTINGDALDPASETVLIDNILSPNGNHNGGDLHFGKDGFLYVSVGDGGADYAGDSGGAGDNDAARDTHILLGKILRITRDGSIPPGNPWTGGDSARCNQTGKTDVGKKCQETFAWGLRNPFRIAFDPNAAGTRFFINDVGQNAREEISESRLGGDYGWNCREGTRVNRTTGKCNPTPANMVDPVHEYDHNTGCKSITGGAFVPNNVWSAEFNGAYLFSDYVCGKMFKLTPKVGGGYVASEFVTGLGNSSAVHMAFGPYQQTQALYYTTFANKGEVRRVVYTAGNDRAPVASIVTNPPAIEGTVDGPTGLSVTFDATSSRDPDGDTLTYEWDFGNGQKATGAKPPAQTFTENKVHTVTLTVKDPQGEQGTATIRVDAGNRRPDVPTVTPGLDTIKYSVGQPIELRGAANDPDQNQLTFTWEVIIHHDDHTHPYVAPKNGASVQFTAPPPEDLVATENSYLEVKLTASDGRSQRTLSQNMMPKTVPVTFETEPAGLQLTLNGVGVKTKTTITSWEGYVLNVTAPPQTAGGKWMMLDRWDDGSVGARAITTPGAATTFKATFKEAKVVMLPIISR